jgi:guanine deaminase
VALPTDSPSGLHVHRGEVLHFLSDPGTDARPESFEHFRDGALILRDGRIESAGPADALLANLPAGIPVTTHPDCILVPGFIDTHIHYPQVDVIASGGRELLDWLRDYTFPEEDRFSDFVHARAVAEVFLDELMRNGTTTALVFCTVHSPSVDAFFEVAQRRNLRMIAGKVLMDRNCPAYLAEPLDAGERATRELIERWHGRERLSYAITPRFAPTSSDEQLASAGRLAQEYPNTYIHSHLAENRNEIAWVRELFPQARSYLDVYDRFGLVRDRAVYAHCLHMDAPDRLRMAQAGAAASFCPSSNLFLGSGLFDLAATDAARLRFSLGTDVGGGTSFSMLRTMADAYKVAQLSGQRLSPLRSFYLATLGAARCLGLEGRIGQFVPGAEADFIALDRRASPLIARRTERARSLADLLLILMTLGDERVVRATHVMGRRLHGGDTCDRPQSSR